ncbi:MAG TPA: hypothetical protein VGG72_11580 [Bryobacteraceae bacterium]|jgi:mono/diheme cytochrome c family protein
MPKPNARIKIFAGLFLIPFVWIGWAAALRGQSGDQAVIASEDRDKPCPAQAYNQDIAELKLSTSEMAPEVQAGYHMFREKCGLCHSLNQHPTKSESSAQDWTHMVNRMEAMPSSHMTDADAASIAKFVIWEGDYSNDMVKTLMAFDVNHDGKLTRSEVPERMQPIFDRADKNKDGVVTPDEIKKLAEAEGASVVVSRGDCDPEHRLK